MRDSVRDTGGSPSFHCSEARKQGQRPGKPSGSDSKGREGHGSCTQGVNSSHPPPTRALLVSPALRRLGEVSERHCALEEQHLLSLSRMKVQGPPLQLLQGAGCRSPAGDPENGPPKSCGAQSGVRGLFHHPGSLLRGRRERGRLPAWLACSAAGIVMSVRCSYMFYKFLIHKSATKCSPGDVAGIPLLLPNAQETAKKSRVS